MTKDELWNIAEQYCATRPGSAVMDVSVEKGTITTWFHGAILTSNADKVMEMLGIIKDGQKIA